MKYRLDREKIQTGIFDVRGSESLGASSELDLRRGDRARRALIGRHVTRNTTGSLWVCFLEGARVRGALLHPSSTHNTSNTTTSKMSAIAAVGLPALRAPVRAARRTTASKVRTHW